jgi:hypothetical protein
MTHFRGMTAASGDSDAGSYKTANSGDGPVSKRRKVAIHSITAMVEGTAATLMTLGGVYCTEDQGTTHASGNMKYPAATVAFGLIYACLGMAVQAIGRRPNRRTIGITIALIGLATTGTALTAMGAATERNDIGDVIKANLEEMMMTYAKGQGPQDTIVDSIQTTYKCCGADNYTTYADTRGYRHGAVPTSCCRKQEKGCGTPPLGDNTHTNGCTMPIHEATAKMLHDVATATAIAAFTMTGVDATMLVYWIARL